eukprot:128352-Chlamydomonas_euryale.AAC.1
MHLVRSTVANNKGKALKNRDKVRCGQITCDGEGKPLTLETVHTFVWLPKKAEIELLTSTRTSTRTSRPAVWHAAAAQARCVHQQMHLWRHLWRHHSLLLVVLVTLATPKFSHIRASLDQPTKDG